MSKNVFLKVNARHVGQLGRELVTDYVTALVELVKNSYDADAEGVKIQFEDILTGEGRIIIVDTGKGMTQNDIINKWAVIGTNNKVRDIYSPKYKRKYAGKKGIGRFAVERLAEHCTIYSFTSLEKPFKYFVNWNSFEGINATEFSQRMSVLKDHNDISSAKYLKVLLEFLLGDDDVSSEDKDLIKSSILEGRELSYKLFLNVPLLLEGYEKILIPILEKYRFCEKRIEDIKTVIIEPDPEELDSCKKMLVDYYDEIGKKHDRLTGTVLILDYLRDDWKNRDIQKVKKELLLLVAPSIIQDSAFNIKLTAKDFNIVDVQLSNDILNLCHVKIDCFFSNEEDCFTIKYWDKTEGEQVLSFKTEKKKCGDFSGTIYYFLRGNNLRSDTIKQTVAKSILDAYCGIKLYRDGFRVRPYGEDGNDWLLLDQQKVKDPHAYLVGNNQVIGVINLSEITNPLMIDATNREGIIENEAFEHFKDLVKIAVNCISERRKKRYIEEISKKNLDRLDDNENNLSNKRADAAVTAVASATEAIRKHDTETAVSQVMQLAEILEQERKSKESHYRDTKFIFEERIRSKDAELNLYKNLASLGILAGTFGHETNGIISRISTDLDTLQQAHQLQLSNDFFEKTHKRMELDVFRVQGYSTLIVSFLKKHKREIKTHLNFGEIVREVMEYYKSIIESYDIEVDLTCLGSFESCVEMFRIDVESIIINMFTNAFEALKSCQRKKIKISTIDNIFGQKMIFEDSGNGIESQKREWVFGALNTTKEEDGVGLGLTIVKDIVTKYGGKINIEDSNDLGGTRFVILFYAEEKND